MVLFVFLQVLIEVFIQDLADSARSRYATYAIDDQRSRCIDAFNEIAYPLGMLFAEDRAALQRRGDIVERELQDILAVLPDDMLLLIRGFNGYEIIIGDKIVILLGLEESLADC